MLGALDREHQRVGGGEAQSAAQPRKILLPSGHKNVIIAGFGGGVIEDRQARNEGGPEPLFLRRGVAQTTIRKKDERMQARDSPCRFFGQKTSLAVDRVAQNTKTVGVLLRQKNR